MRHTSGRFSCLTEGEEMTGKDPKERYPQGVRAFIFPSGSRAIDSRAFRDDKLNKIYDVMSKKGKSPSEIYG